MGLLVLMLVISFSGSLTDFLEQQKQLIVFPLFFFSCALTPFYLNWRTRTEHQISIENQPTNEPEQNERRWKKKAFAKLRHKVTDSCIIFFVNFFFNIMGMGWFVMQINRKSKFNFDKLKLATSSTFPFNIISYLFTYRASVEFYIRRFLTSRLRNFIRLALLSFELRL